MFDFRRHKQCDDGMNKKNCTRLKEDEERKIVTNAKAGIVGIITD